MPEVHLTIAQRTYRLAVRSSEEGALTECAARVDSCITQLRAQSRLPSTEHSAVLAALQIAFEDRQKIQELEAQVHASQETPQTLEARITPREPISVATPQTRQKLPLEMTSRTQRHQDLEKQWTKEIQELCALCEKELFFTPRTKSLF